MKLLEERILKEGRVRPGNILKVDSFLNHQLDICLLDELGAEFFAHFKDCGITKIVTIESSGIAIACMAARHFHVPVVFAKKSKSKNLDGDLYRAVITSYTHGGDYTAVLEQRFLNESDNILILDDFLATGSAQRGLLSIAQQAGAKVAGIGIAVEKGFQGGGDELRSEGYDVYSLALIDHMTDDSVTFR